MTNLRSYLPHFSVFLVAVCVYAGTVTHEQVLDDLELIPNQPAIRNPWHVQDILLGRYWGVLREHDVLYRPLTIFTLSVNYWTNEVIGLGGEHPAVYHMTDVLLHALVSVEVKCVVRLIFRIHRISVLGYEVSLIIGRELSFISTRNY